MQISSSGIALIKQFEGCKLVAYKDQGGIWTIGYGHTAGVCYSMTCSQDQADAWFMEDVAGAVAAVNSLVTVKLTQNQFDALVSFTFNLGRGKFAGSSMLRALNAGKYAVASSWFPAWSHIGQDVSGGLLARRKAEQALFNKP